jgi:hypothetical protein
MTASCTLNWYSNRGFELDLESAGDEISVRLVGVPVPADGLAELRAAPVALHALDILFKAQVDIEQGPGQFQDAAVQLSEVDGAPVLVLSANIEDVETEEIIPYTVEAAVLVPDAPESGGPRPSETLEDELDWEDETTLERLVVAAPESTPGAAPAKRVQEERSGGGLEALLKALANIDDEDEPGPISTEELPRPPEPEPVVQPEGDQTFSADQEARGFLELLIAREALELEDGQEIAALVGGVKPILAMQVPPSKMAAILSEWLLDQEAVADLYVGDEDLAEMLEQW